MTHRRTLARLLFLGTLVAGGLVAAAPPAAADFHLMSIREVLPNGPGSADFVELQMYSPGQTNVDSHTLTVYDNAGNPSTTPPFGMDVPNGQSQRTILIATATFQAQTGITPDFATLPAVMTSSGGAVCFETVDCVEWGTGVISVNAGTPAAAPADGQSIERKITPGCATLLESSDDTDDSLTDFTVQPTPNPEPNSATPDETPCAPGTPGGTPVLQGLKTKVKGNRAIISGQIQPPAPGEQVKLTFFANGSPLRKIAKKSATLNADSKFKKKFGVPTDSTRCKVKVAFQGQAVGQKKFRC